MIDILQNRFSVAASLEVLDLDNDGKYMVIEKGMYIKEVGKCQPCFNLKKPQDVVQIHTAEENDNDEPEE